MLSQPLERVLGYSDFHTYSRQRSHQRHHHFIEHLCKIIILSKLFTYINSYYAVYIRGLDVVAKHIRLGFKAGRVLGNQGTSVSHYKRDDR